MATTDINADTANLKNLLDRADETGSIAWRIGEIASRIWKGKTYEQLKIKTFGEYTKEKFRKTEDTVDVYIDIYSNFKFDEVSDMLFSHLREFVKIKETKIRNIAIQTFRDLRSKYIKSKSLEEKAHVFTTEEIKKVVKIISISKSEQSRLEDDIVKEIVTEVFNIKRAKEETKPDKHGKEFKYPNFTEVLGNMAFEPIDEQGTVALFCLLFSELKKYHFTKIGKTMSFSKIVFVRSRFPDACIYCHDHTDRFSYAIMAEFEFKSKSYEDHLLSKEPCQLIICWENNLNREIYRQGFPPIISLKNFLETGKINMF
ncbi:MAG: hypothetical protein EAZ97_05045 [Bacteroidetes bacterium]|nr:MAG: hypothetical protein EAZ97_05045 [Bacteroidota bacterium]